MKESKTITFGDILDRLGRDDTDIRLYEPSGDDALTGPADCVLWEPLEDRPIEVIGVDEGVLEVWLKEESE